MTTLAGAAVAVIGGGVFGLASALRLQAAGAGVRLYDPFCEGESASGVAAGMLAPGLETLFDPAAAGHYELLAGARDRWPALLELAGERREAVDFTGALFVADDERLGAEFAARAAREGVPFEALSERQARWLQPGLAAGTATIYFLSGEWRVSPPGLMATLAAALERLGGRIVRARVVSRDGGVWTEAGEPLAADLVVIAAGADAGAFVGLAPVLARLAPIKGQILKFDGGPAAGPIVRSARAYVSPQPGGALVGATMEQGVADRTLDPAVLARFRDEAAWLFPELGGAVGFGRAGVRATTPDGLPLVGRAGADGVILAAGARRNGWLLAPLVAELVVAAAEGAPPSPFRPDRFAST